MKRCFSYLPFLLFILAGCTAPTVGDTGAVRQTYALRFPVSLTVRGDFEEQAADAAISELVRVEQSMLSPTQKNSQLSMLNDRAGSSAPIPLGPKLFQLLERAQALGLALEGAFSITLAPVLDAWGFLGEAYRVPGQAELDALLPLTDSRQLVLDQASSRVQFLNPDMAVDLSGVSRGYSTEQVVDLLQGYQVDSALLALGSCVTALGSRTEAEPWRVAVQDPADNSSYLCVFPLQDKTACTAGGYEQSFTQDGRSYHNILNPETGWPADSGLASVTVVSEDSLLADAYSHGLYVLGADRALALWRASDQFELVLCTADGAVLVTEGLQDGLEFRGEQNGYSLQIIRR